MTKWKRTESESLYNVPEWGGRYVSVNEAGNVQVHPEGPDGHAIDVFELVGQICRRGVAAPILLRFDGLLRARVREVHAAFDTARAEYGYEAPYRCVYPIKVNQERLVVETLLQEGRAHGMGLEVGSKPELIAGIALQAGGNSLMICNGYKDEEYVEMALMSKQLGIKPIIVIEKYTELDTVLDAAERLGQRPTIGVRTKLSFRGSGRWQDSVGDRSKFGLTTREIVQVVERLREVDMLDCLQLQHFHIGSQITHIRSIKQAMREATNTLVGLTRMGVKIHWFDAGGGLGIDYDGSCTNFDSSKNYSLQEYANDIVWNLKEACRTAEIDEPNILTESGRALVAHHAVLASEVMGASSFTSAEMAEPIGDADHEIVSSLAELTDDLTSKNYLEAYHDALDLREEAMLLFNTGQLTLPDRARVEDFFWRATEAVLAVTRSLDYVPEDLEHLERDLADTYFLNMSIFQSIPDSWAIGQLFPIIPLHRHLERPTRHTTIADLTCDSDGKITRFIDMRDVKSTLELHTLKPSEPYFLGFFLVGAYQEILGDMHNLFGDTNTVHVDVDASGKPRLTHVLRGDRVKDVLSYVEYFEEDILRGLRRHVEDALDEGRMSYEDSALFWDRYEAGLRGYTYLTRLRRPEGPARPHQETKQLEDPAQLRR
ncbi:MAG: biosynthetic arginine decarboxylase [bacterium]|nr:biosynthetic arginine decarboxylase [bacterium]